MQGKKLTFDGDMMTILAMIRGWQPPPSIDEMLRATSAKSISTVDRRLHWLEDEGYIDRNVGTNRTYVATQKGLDKFPEFHVLKKRDGVNHQVQ